MLNKLKTIGKIAIAVSIMLGTAMPANASLVFTNDVFQNEANIFRIGQGYDASTNDIQLQFGTTNTQTFMWGQADQAFHFSNNINLNSNQMINARVENANGSNSLPGGAPGPGIGARGRIVQLTGTDTQAPGCTISPNCGGGTYVWDGGTWISLHGTTSSNFNKLITVGSTGSDYTTIANGAAYLQTLSGGIMLLSAETHNVTTPVNMTNIIVIGKEASRTTINITGAGKLASYDTTYEYLTIKTGAITDTMAIDVQAGSNALLFDYVDINIQDTGDSLIDSSAGTPPTTTMKFIKSNMAGGSGTVLKTKALSNLNAASAIYVDSRSSDTPLQMSDWSLTLSGGGSVNTSGIISPIPADSIIVSPNMNLQGAIDSLHAAGRGGLITLLPGTYNVSSTLLIQDNAIQLVGYGDSSIINASGFTGGSTVAAIQVGLANGTHPVNDAVLRDFKLLVSGTGATDIHGIRVTGGEDNIINNVTVQKSSGQSGSGATARMGIQMTDAAAGCTGTCILTRPVVIDCRVLGDSTSSSYFTDGIHVTSDPSYNGVFGNNQGIVNALVDGNNVDYVRETAYVFVGASNSSLYNNRASRMGAGGTGAYGIFMGNVRDTNMTANVFNTSLSATAIAIGIDPFNTGALKQTLDSIFTNNVIDGTGTGSLGFATGFQVGNATNVEVSRNSFQNNTIRGAATGTTTAFAVTGNGDDNTISDNDIGGGTNAWTTGVSLGSALEERNLVSLNRFTNTTTLISDSGTATKIGVSQHRATVNPTVTDDIAAGYVVGMIWVNTTSNTAFILTNATVGAAVWQAVGGGGSSSLQTAYNNGSTITTAGSTPITFTLSSGGFNVTGTGATSIGNNTGTVAVDSTSWDISAAGIASGLTGVTSANGTISLNDNSAASTTSIGGGTTTGTITIGGIGTQTLNIGNGAGAKIMNLGSSNTTSSTTLLSGSGGLNFNVNNNQTTNINTGTSTSAVNIGNTTGGVIIGGGTSIKRHLSGTNSLNFGATAARTCDALTITVTGATDGDTVTLGIPTGLSGSDANQSFWGYVSAANTVTVKRCNLTNTALSNPAAYTVRADVWQH